MNVLSSVGEIAALRCFVNSRHTSFTQGEL